MSKIAQFKKKSASDAFASSSIFDAEMGNFDAEMGNFDSTLKGNAKIPPDFVENSSLAPGQVGRFRLVRQDFGYCEALTLIESTP